MALYTKALAETGSALPRHLFADVAKPVQRYALGLYSLSSGQFRSAERVFTDLTTDKANGFLGLLGLAFYAETAGNPALMLDALSRIDADPRYSRSAGRALLRELYMSANEIQGKAHEVERLLKQDQSAPPGEKLDSAVRMRYQINVALYRDRFSEAKRLLNEYVKMFGEDENAILLRASLIQLTQGPKAELRYVETKAKHSRSPQVQARLALATLDDGRRSVARTLVRQLVDKRPFDLSLKLVFADMVDVFNIERDALNTMRHWFDEIDDSPALTARLALAEYFSARDRERGLALLNLAERQFPLSREVLFARHTIARDKGDFSEARGSLERYVAAYPNEVGARALLMDLLHEARETSAARRVAEGLSASGRWMPAEQRERVKMIRDSK